MIHVIHQFDDNCGNDKVTVLCHDSDLYLGHVVSNLGQFIDYYMGDT